MLFPCDGMDLERKERTIRIRKLLLICEHNVTVVRILRILNSHGENAYYEQDHAT